MQGFRERSRTPSRQSYNDLQRAPHSPYARGKRNENFVNPSFVSHECFYEPHYENKMKEKTPPVSPLGRKPNGYGEFDGYKLGRHQNPSQKARRDISPKPGQIDRRVLENEIRKNIQDSRQLDGKYGRRRSRSRMGDRTPKSYKGSTSGYSNQYDGASRTGSRKGGALEVRKSRTPSRYQRPSHQIENFDEGRSEDLSVRASRSRNMYPDGYDKKSRTPTRKSRTPVRKSRTPTRGGRSRTPVRDGRYFEEVRPQEVYVDDMKSRTPSRNLNHQLQEEDDYRIQRSRTPSRSQFSEVEDQSRSNAMDRRENARNRRKSQLLKKRSRGSRTPGGKSRSRQKSRSRTPSRLSKNQSAMDESSHSYHSRTHSHHSNMTQSTYAGKQLICDGCVNKKLMTEKELRKEQERQQDRMYQDAMQTKMQNELAKERERERQKKLRFMKEAKDHWDLTQNIKEQRKMREKDNDHAFNALMFEDDDRFKKDRGKKLRNRKKLRDDLRNQIREKTMEKKRKAKEDQQNRGLTGYPIGGEYVDRYQRMKMKHIDELRGQIEEKKKRKQEEKEVDKVFQDQYEADLHRIQREDDMRRRDREQKRKDHFKREIENARKEKEKKRTAKEQEKERELELEMMQTRQAMVMEDQRQRKIKEREAKHLQALQNQIKESQQRRKREQEERRKYPVPIFKEDKAEKSYPCHECENNFPITRLSKQNRPVDSTADPDLDYHY